MYHLLLNLQLFLNIIHLILKSKNLHQQNTLMDCYIIQTKSLIVFFFLIISLYCVTILKVMATPIVSHFKLLLFHLCIGNKHHNYLYNHFMSIDLLYHFNYEIDKSLQANKIHYWFLYNWSSLMKLAIHLQYDHNSYISFLFLTPSHLYPHTTYYN